MEEMERVGLLGACLVIHRKEVLTKSLVYVHTRRETVLVRANHTFSTLEIVSLTKEPMFALVTFVCG